jgi:hypothetical protein
MPKKSAKPKPKKDSKTSIWIYGVTMEQLERYRKGGESWEEFLKRTAPLTRFRDYVSVPKRSNLPSDRKRATLWVNTSTRVMLNEFRVGNESWDGYFARLLNAMREGGISKNPNTREG